MGRPKPSRDQRRPKVPQQGPPPLDVDAGLMKRASVALSIMTPGRMPVLMDAMAAKQKALFGWYEKAMRRTEQKMPWISPDSSYDHLARGITNGLDLEALAERDAGSSREGTQAAFDAMGAYLMSAEVGMKSIEGRHAYFATEEMTALILAGAETVETFALTPSDLPSANGFAYLYRPDGEALVLWWMSVGDDGVCASLVSARTLLGWLKDTSNIQHPHLFHSAILSPVGSEEAPRRVLFADPYRWLRDAPGDSIKLNADRALPVLFSLTHMMRQEVVDVATHETPPVPTNRKGMTPKRGDRVTYLSMKRSVSSGGSHGTSGRQYASRWVVRGFWRRQWYPSLKRHYPIWIMEYIKGPKDAPLVFHDKVTIVKTPTE